MQRRLVVRTRFWEVVVMPLVVVVVLVVVVLVVVLVVIVVLVRSSRSSWDWIMVYGSRALTAVLPFILVSTTSSSS